MLHILDTLKRRGFVDSLTHEEELYQKLKVPSIFYVGFDPTATSLHIGHTVTLFAAAHLQQAGHTPLIVVGQGTAFIGDPSGKTEERPLLLRQEIVYNAEQLRTQFECFLNFEGPNRARILSNDVWLKSLNYLDFLREFGRYFSVNQMLSFESSKRRLETGLSFLEFNYQILQAYDFWHLYKHYHCVLQLGGSDQWGNIVSGLDLIRKLDRGKAEAYGLTVPLIVTSDGKKMGKTEGGAVFLDSKLTSPFDCYQYFRNVQDADVKRFLLLFTFLQEEIIDELTQEGGQALNEAKIVLAYEVVKQIHGKAQAEKAKEQARSLFEGVCSEKNAPEVIFSLADLRSDLQVSELFVLAELCQTKSQARRLIEQGGARINSHLIQDAYQTVHPFASERYEFLLQAGKKRFVLLKFKDIL